MYWYRATLGPAEVGFTNRELGNVGLHVGDDPDEVRRRRHALERDLGVADGALVFLEQVHGVAVADADGLDPGQTPTADAAVSATGRAMAVMVADCVPVLLVGTNPQRPELCVTAVAHAGRKGLLGGILQATVAAMRDRGAGDLQALVGPCVCGGCYEVPAAMAAESEALLPGVQAQTTWGTPSLDLPHAAVALLASMGVAATRAEAAGGSACTLENETLSSHRRDPASGRIAGVIVGPAPSTRGFDEEDA